MESIKNEQDIKEINMSELSPMMKHYLDTKEEYNDCILFYRLGDFYEMFFDDAKIVAKELELTLTGKSCGLKERAPMCGVPYHSAEMYINRLIKNGYKVAICEQVEDPKTAKGMVKREVIRVVTPGTNTDTDALDDGKNNYILSIMYIGDKFGMAFSDFSTGEFYVAELEKAPQLLDEINKLVPAEIIANEYFFMSGLDISEITRRLNIAVSTLPNNEFSEEYAHHCMNKLLSDEVSGFSVGLMAAGALFSYMSKMQKSGIEHITSVNVYDPRDHMIVDSSTLRNLELVETMRERQKKGSLLGVIDSTRTSMGKRMLRNMIEKPLLDPKRINNRLDAVEAFIKNPIDREELREYLEPVHDLERLLTRISCKTATPRDLVSFKFSLQTIPAVKNILGDFKVPILEEALSQMDDLRDVYDLIDSAIVDEPPVSLKEGGLLKEGFCETADEYRRAKTEGRDWLAQIEAKEKENTGIKNLKVKFNKVFGYYLEVTNSFKDMVPEDWIRKQTLTNAERYITPELKKIEDTILGANDKLNALEYEIFCEIRDKTAAEALRIQTLARALAVVDCLSGLARVAEKYSYVRPGINTSGIIEIKDGRHPVVERTINSDSFVANDTFLNNQDRRISLITGPNMAGKSTYMRQTALITLMAHIGSFVPARSANICITDRIFTRVGASDDLASGQSTFMVEMNEVAGILKNATKSSLLVLDEIGRGTGTLDGLSIARAVVEYISDTKKIGAKTLFATHYHELTSLEDEIPGVFNCSIAVKENGDDIVFLRKIVPGGADKSYGIHVAKLAGVPDVVTDRARYIMKELSESEEMSEKPVFSSPSDKQISFFENRDKDEITFSEEEIEKLGEIRKELEGLDVNHLTPVGALEMLFKLQQKIKE